MGANHFSVYTARNSPSARKFSDKALFAVFTVLEISGTLVKCYTPISGPNLSVGGFALRRHNPTLKRVRSVAYPRCSLAITQAGPKTSSYYYFTDLLGVYAYRWIRPREMGESLLSLSRS